MKRAADQFPPAPASFFRTSHASRFPFCLAFISGRHGSAANKAAYMIMQAEDLGAQLTASVSITARVSGLQG